MAAPPAKADSIVMRALHDKSGWRVRFILTANGVELASLEGAARFVDEAACHEHGRAMYTVMNHVLGLDAVEPSNNGVN